MGTVQSLGNTGSAGAFKGMEGLVSEAKEIPFALSQAVTTLAEQSGSNNLDNQSVINEVKKQNKITSNTPANEYLDVEKQKNRPYWIQAYCLPVEAFEENLIKPKEKKNVNETST